MGDDIQRKRKELDCLGFFQVSAASVAVALAVADALSAVVAFSVAVAVPLAVIYEHGAAGSSGLYGFSYDPA